MLLASLNVVRDYILLVRFMWLWEKNMLQCKYFSLRVYRNVQCDEVNDIVSDDNDYECLCDAADDDD